MANKMLIDAAHPEETRVVVVRGNRVEEFDYEAATRQQLRGNIYLARVTRVEPSLQAAFVDYGGNRHGFLAFSEIHPDYYQIPVADREALLAEEAESDRGDGDFDLDSNGDDKPAKKRSRRSRAKTRSNGAETASVSADVDDIAEAKAISGEDDTADSGDSDTSIAKDDADSTNGDADEAGSVEAGAGDDDAPEADDDGLADDDTDSADAVAEARSEDADAAETEADTTAERAEGEADTDAADDAERAAAKEDVEQVGSEDALEEVPVRKARPRRSYKIQEVIKRRQIMLVQVVKEERGNKGAALTTYLSLAGRYCVLMPNTARGGGISRKITNASDRKRLKDVAKSLDVPQGMGLILRTAGASRTKTEVKRDYEYLLRLWESVRERTLSSIAPTLVYEEGSLVKRAIRDLYNKEINEVLVAGDDAYREAKDFMRMLMPSHAKNVQPYKEDDPIFTRYSVEGQLDAMFNPQVTLKSGGYIVINQTEALVSIDVNSGRATREHSIEDTALKTNLEAAEEVARQLRLRDLAGLIVIDFIDMDENRNNRAVERKLKDCLKTDRARIQVGRISHFGLMEMSRQRLRPGLLEGSLQICEHCQGTGYVRSTESVALHVIRTFEDELMRRPADLIAKTSTAAALYVLNNKRDHLVALESRFGVSISVEADDHLSGSLCLIERGDPRKARPKQAETPLSPVSETMDEPDEEDTVTDAAESDHDRAEEGSGRRRRRRSRRGGDKRRDERDDTVEAREDASADDAVADAAAVEASDDSGSEDNGAGDGEDRNGKSRRRRRGRRGGRRRGERAGGETEAQDDADTLVSAPPGDDDADHTDMAPSDGVVANGHDAEEATTPATGVDEEPAGVMDTAADATLAPEDTNGAEPMSASDAQAATMDDDPIANSDDAVADAEADAHDTNEVQPEPAEAKPDPAPVVEEAPAGPPRKGWWQRRLLGG
ncbi:MAG: Rne/Rng family ribonuclease [Pseudomonadota bacterium]